MSEKYILMGHGIPSIIPNDQTTPGTRLTATEARQYARRLVELADELTSTAPPAPSADDARIAEIRDTLKEYDEIMRAVAPYPEATRTLWLNGIESTRLREIEAAAPGAIRDLLVRLDDFTEWKESADTVLLDHAALLHDDLKDYGSPAQNLREVVMNIIARLDAVTKRAERAEKFCAEIAELSVLSSTIQYMNASADVLGKFILANPDEYRRIMTQYHAKESPDG